MAALKSLSRCLEPNRGLMKGSNKIGSRTHDGFTNAEPSFVVPLVVPESHNNFMNLTPLAGDLIQWSNGSIYRD
jgi:hypothetical protein